MHKSKSLVFIATILGFAVLYYAETVVVTLLFSVFLFIFLDPIAQKLAEFKISRSLSSPILVLLSVIVFSWVGFTFYNSLKDITSELPTYSEKITSVMTGFYQKTDPFVKGTNDILNGSPTLKTPAALPRPAGDQNSHAAITEFLWKGFNSAVSLMTTLFFIPLITLFLLLEKGFLHQRLLEATKDPAAFEKICFEIRETTRGFFMGNFLLGSSMTLIFGVVFALLHLQNPFGLALYAGFLNLIPIFGTVLGVIIPAIQAFMQFDGFKAVIIIGITSLCMHFIGNNIVMPRLIGNRINVNTTATLVGFLVWGYLWGAIGLFLATPLMAILRILLMTNENSRVYANLIGKVDSSKPEPISYPLS